MLEQCSLGALNPAPLLRCSWSQTLEAHLLPLQLSRLAGLSLLQGCAGGQQAEQQGGACEHLEGCQKEDQDLES